MARRLRERPEPQGLGYKQSVAYKERLIYREQDTKRYIIDEHLVKWGTTPPAYYLFKELDQLRNDV